MEGHSYRCVFTLPREQVGKSALENKRWDDGDAQKLELGGWRWLSHNSENEHGEFERPWWYVPENKRWDDGGAQKPVLGGRGWRW